MQRYAAALGIGGHQPLGHNATPGGGEDHPAGIKEQFPDRVSFLSYRAV